jgi:hypothetical protein
VLPLVVPLVPVLPVLPAEPKGDKVPPGDVVVPLVPTLPVPAVPEPVTWAFAVETQDKQQNAVRTTLVLIVFFIIVPPVMR